MEEKSVAIILAGGTGERMKAAVPKQFLEVSGKPVIIHTLEQFEKSDPVSDIVIVCCEKAVDILEDLIKERGLKKIYKVAAGGRTRQESSFIGVKNCPPETGTVLIHDAVRPFVTEQMIADILQAVKETGAAAPAIDIEDTVIMTGGDLIKDIPARKTLKRIQTPQGFDHDLIFKAHENALKKGITDATDDCGLVIAMDKTVKVVKGSIRNIKITDRSDLVLAEQFIRLKG